MKQQPCGPFPLVPDAEQRLARAAELLVRYPFRCWFYGDSIGFEGLLAASELLDRPRWADFAYGYVRAWAARDQPFRPDDNTAPGPAMCALAKMTGDRVLREAVLRLGEHLALRRRIRRVSVTFEDASHSLRRPYGGAKLDPEAEALLADPGPGIYTDCLHFGPPFFAHLARLTGEHAWAERAVEEALGYGDLLLDPRSGLYHHFWLEQPGRAYAPGWGRGQGWALLGLLDVAALLRPDIAGWDELARRAGALGEAMLALQRPDGGWHAVAHEPSSGEESSTAAFMAAAFRRGMALGVLDEGRFGPAAEAAWQWTWERVAADGTLGGVSVAVYSSTEPDHYRHVPTGSAEPWGQGPLLVAALLRSHAASADASP